MPGKTSSPTTPHADSESWNDELNFYGWSIEVARSSKLEVWMVNVRICKISNVMYMDGDFIVRMVMSIDRIHL